MSKKIDIGVEVRLKSTGQNVGIVELIDYVDRGAAKPEDVYVYTSSGYSGGYMYDQLERVDKIKPKKYKYVVETVVTTDVHWTRKRIQEWMQGVVDSYTPRESDLVRPLQVRARPARKVN